MIILAGVAELSYYMRQTRALSGTMIARSRGFVGAQNIAFAIATVLLQSVSVESRFADLAFRTGSVEQALKTMTGVRIAISGSAQVRVVAAVAELTAATRYLRMAEVIFGAVLAPRSGVSFETFAHHVLGYRVQRATVGVRMAGFTCACRGGKKYR